MKQKHFLAFLLANVFFSSTFVIAQNSYKFIEPNISFAYDSTQIKIAHRYSNTFYETESYDFKPTSDTAYKITINVAAKQPVPNPMSIQEQEKTIEKRIAEMGEFTHEKVSLIEYDHKVKHIGDFLCFGFIFMDKTTKKTLSTIICNHVSNADFTGIKLTSFNRKSLTQDYKLLESFLPGFKSYTKEKMSTEDSLINSKYSINVSPTLETIDNLKWRNNAYFAIVKTNELLHHKVREVRLDIGYGKEIFPANDNGEVYIACPKKEKGMIEKKGELIIVNSFGKNVKIPFTFKFYNP